MPHRQVESNNRNRFQVSFNVYKYGLCLFLYNTSSPSPTNSSVGSLIRYTRTVDTIQQWTVETTFGVSPWRAMSQVVRASHSLTWLVDARHALLWLAQGAWRKVNVLYTRTPWSFCLTQSQLCCSSWVHSIEEVRARQAKVLIKNVAVFFLFPSKEFLPISFKFQLLETSPQKQK